MTATFSKQDTNKIKGLAITLLLFHHCFVNSGRYSDYQIIFSLISEAHVNHLAHVARICVAIFTFLSAYGMTRGYRGKKLTAESVVKGYRHRIVSLIGNFIFVYAIIVLFGTLVMHDGRFSNYGGNVLYIVLDALGLAGLFHTPTYLFTWWYESLALVIILLLPFLLWLYRRVGPVFLLVLGFLPTIIFDVDNTSPYEFLQIPNYMFCICLGIVSAERGWIEKIGMTGKNKAEIVIKISLEFALACIVAELNYRLQNTIWQALTEGFGAFSIILFCHNCLNRIPGIKKIIGVLGAYSGTIYIIHNMFRSSWLGPFIYGFRIPILVVAVLLAVSLLAAFGIKKLEELVHYDRLIRKLR